MHIKAIKQYGSIYADINDIIKTYMEFPINNLMSPQDIALSWTKWKIEVEEKFKETDEQKN